MCERIRSLPFSPSRPLYCGEFGDDDIGCALWTYKQMDFGLIGEHYDSIREDLIGLYVK